MKRILVYGMTDNPGGVENFIMNYYRHMDRNNIQFDILCDTHAKLAYEDEVLALGGRVFHFTPRRENPVEYTKALLKIFRDHASEWSAVWINMVSLTKLDYLKYPKWFGIKKRIIHSHNSRSMEKSTNYRDILHYLNRYLVGKYATDFWACSEDAAKWFYTGAELRKADIIHNAIDVERMAFDSARRDAIRALHGWGDKYVIGNVGRIHFQKNQSFAIDIFKYYYSEHPNSVLVFVGQGNNTALKEKARALDIEDAVYFAGVQNDIQAWLSSFDLFLFPSRFEGLSISAMEAQANGIPVLASKGVIPDEVRINENFVFFDLDRGAEAWSKEIEEMSHMEREAYSVIKKRFEIKGYDIQTEAEKLEKMLVEQ